MRKRRTAAILLPVLVVIVAGAIHWSLGTCRLLDRLLGLSGCRGSVVVANFLSLDGVTMSAPDADGVSSLFGTVVIEDGAAPAMIRLNPETGSETARYPLRLQGSLIRVTLAADGERAGLDCVTTRYCAETGESVSIVSLHDGAEIETADAWQQSPRPALGDPEPGPPFSFDAIFADAGKRIVSRDSDALRIYTTSGQVVAEITSSRWTRPKLSVSPSGRYIALVEDATKEDDHQKFQIWDVRDGTHRATLEMPTDYRSQGNLVWSADEAGLFSFRRVANDTYIDRFALPKF
ncbi:hypothetical protein [Shinella oryzae]|uniref:WD40 repeat protein n=1 Tax=Shinella oryzae TaxID=2871820 RepID=A0ABY9KB48_9HYPH|nr:hypothetical protein [Shinella oryzae]WLS05229.1 hypothetical protein Q9315_24045 [Shinella oryzae]